MALLALALLPGTCSAQGAGDMPQPFFFYNVSIETTGFPQPGVPFNGFDAIITYSPSGTLYFTFDKDGRSEPTTATPVTLEAMVPTRVNLGTVVYPQEGRFIGVLRVYHTPDLQGGPFTDESLPAVWRVIAAVGDDANNRMTFSSSFDNGGTITVKSAQSGLYYWSFENSIRFNITLVAGVDTKILLARYLAGSYPGTFSMWSSPTTAFDLFSITAYLRAPSQLPEAELPGNGTAGNTTDDPNAPQVPPPRILVCNQTTRKYRCSAQFSMQMMVRGRVLSQNTVGNESSTINENQCLCRAMCDANPRSCQGYTFETPRTCTLLSSARGWLPYSSSSIIDSCEVTVPSIYMTTI